MRFICPWFRVPVADKETSFTSGLQLVVTVSASRVVFRDTLSAAA